MSRKTIFQVASEFQSKLKKTAQGYPAVDTIKPIINSVVNSLKDQSKMLNCVNGIDNVSLSQDIEGNINVYFQLVVNSNSYENIINGLDKTKIVNLIEPRIWAALRNNFREFEFKVKMSILPQ
jgi:hypothetical protein